MSQLGCMKTLARQTFVLLSLCSSFALAAHPRIGFAAAAELRVGDPAPAFKAQGDDGKEYSLENLKGKAIVIYFYPKDDTSGCTVEAQGFRDDYEAFNKKGAVVLGVSLDSAASHKEFREKYKLNFPLLVGNDRLLESFGVPSTLGFASRQTFVIGKDGKVLKIYREVTPKGHSAEILKLL